MVRRGCNERNQLTEVSGPDTLTYAYDGLGRRIEITRNGQITATLYDGWNPIQLKEGATVIENRLTGLGLDETYSRTREGITESYLTDALGSTVELRDNTLGQTTQYTYEPYGGTTHSASSTNTIPARIAATCHARVLSIKVLSPFRN